MTERYDHLEKAMCKELEKLDKKYTADTEMNQQDLDRADTLYHALKSAATYHAMKDAEEWDSDLRDGRSSMRGRDARTGRYISRDFPDYSSDYSPNYSPAERWGRRF